MKYNEAIQAIKTRLSIVDLVRRYVDLRRIGNRFMAPCPFHQETKPSFSVNEDMGTFYCFGCQASGDIFEFSMRINGYDFREALEQFAEEFSISLSPNEKMTAVEKEAQKQRQQKRDYYKMHAFAASHFAQNLNTPQSTDCKAYIQERGLSEEIVKQFNLGYSMDSWQDLASALKRSGFNDAFASQCGLLSKNDKNNIYDRFRDRFMFPIYALTGQVVAFGGRIIPSKEPQENLDTADNQSYSKKEEAKYINSADSPIYKKGEHLYGLYQARKAISLAGSALLTEGYMDVLTLHQFGYANAVGVLGTALTDVQVKRLSGFCSRIELLFDGDRAGRKAAFRSAQMLLLAGLECKVVLFPEKEDIDSLLRQEHGQELFAKLRNEAENGLLYCARTQKELSLLDAVVWAREFLSQVQVPEIISNYATLLAGELNIDELEIREQVAKKKFFQPKPQTSTRQGNTASPFSTGQKTIINNQKDLRRDRLILTFAVRYPDSIKKLQAYAIDLILKTPFALQFWNILTSSTPENVFNNLDSQQKEFWISCREGSAPPCRDEQGEFLAVQRVITNYHAHAQKASIGAALRQGKPDCETQREYLMALQEELGRKSEY